MRYIDADVLISILNAKADMAMGTPKEVFFSVAKMVELLPTADVVPKSEVDELQAEIAELKKDRYCISPDGGIELLPRSDVDKIKSEVERLERILNSYTLQYGTVKDQQDIIDKAKAEVAREIFALIFDRLLTSFPVQSFIDAPCTTHDRLFDMLDELQKKYTEAE